MYTSFMERFSETSQLDIIFIIYLHLKIWTFECSESIRSFGKAFSEHICVVEEFLVIQG